MSRRVTVLIGVSLALSACGEGDARPDAALSTEPDAFRWPVGTLYRNRDPVECLDRDLPPRWRAPDVGAPEGTVLWVTSLREERFRQWVAESGGEGSSWPWMPPSLSGDGIATWFAHESEPDVTWGLGLSRDDGTFANSGLFDPLFTARIWLPRHNVLLGAHGRDGRAFYAPPPPGYDPEPSTWLWVDAGIGEAFWTAGALVRGGVQGDMPAWSPVTGDIVTFGFWPSRGRRGAGAGCSEGVRWFTQLPIDEGRSTAYVRPDGDVIIASQTETFVLDGSSGQPLRRAQYRNEDGSPSPPGAYHPGCGVLLEETVGGQPAWQWLDDETMELGPQLMFPADFRVSFRGWSGTPDCGVTAFGGSEAFSLARLDADGSTRFTAVIAPFGTEAGPPVALADGGTLAIIAGPGWVRFDADGNEVSRVALDAGVVGTRTVTEPALAPDGTLFMMTESTTGYQFFAASTRAIPGPFLWPNSGYNWARTNSVLPD